MPTYDKWVISSSGRHMFVKLMVSVYDSGPGFLAKINYIHHGNVINNIKTLHQIL